MDNISVNKIIINATPLQLELFKIRQFCKTEGLDIPRQVQVQSTYLFARLGSLSTNPRGVSDPRTREQLLNWYTDDSTRLLSDHDLMDIGVLKLWLDAIFTPDPLEDPTRHLNQRNQFFAKRGIEIPQLRRSTAGFWLSNRHLRDKLLEAVTVFEKEFQQPKPPMTPEDRIAHRKTQVTRRMDQANEIAKLKYAVTQLAELFINYTPELKDPVDNILKRLNQ